MNFFLHINRNIVFFFGLIILIIFVIFIFSKQINLKSIDLEINENKTSNVDIREPKFAINNNSRKIKITAMEGIFLNENEILLEDRVRFRSNDFTIETEKVIFNRSNHTAQSKTKSFFKSENSIISSNGFNIYDKGDKIIFYGAASLILK